MTSCKCKIFIKNLPDEVLCIIFDYLDIQSVKNVSRTCKRWNSVVFHSAYISRFMFNIDIPSPNMLFEHLNQRKQTIKSLVKELMYTVKHTERQYRNLRLVLKNDVINVFQSMWDVIHPKLTASISSFDLIFGLFTNNYIILLITDAIEQMPKLRSLSLKSNGFVSLHDVVPTMRSTTVEHLKLDTAGFMVDMPQLRSFKGPLFSLLRPVNSPHPLVFAQLKQVKLKGNASRTNELAVVQRIRLVNSMEFSSELSDSLFIAICDTCTSLKELHFRKRLLLFDPHHLDHLSMLRGLRCLTFKSIRAYRDCVLNINLRKLSQLEQLDLGSTALGAASVLTLPNSIKTLVLQIDHENEQNLIYNIISSLEHLTDLCLCSAESEWRPSIETFNALSLLRHLKILQFCCCHITEDYFHGVQTPMHQVRRLVLKHCYIQCNTLLMAKLIFPNVSHVETSNMRY